MSEQAKMMIEQAEAMIAQAKIMMEEEKIKTEQGRKVKRTIEKAQKRLYTYREVEMMLGMKKATIRKYASQCGALIRMSRAELFIDYPRFEEFILSYREE